MIRRWLSDISKLIPAALLVAHTTAVVYTAVFLAATSLECRLFWAFFVIIDFPSSLACMVPLYVLGMIDTATHNFISRHTPEQADNILSAVLFGVVGGAQYYWLGSKLRNLLERCSGQRKANIDPSPNFADT